MTLLTPDSPYLVCRAVNPYLLSCSTFRFYETKSAFASAPLSLSLSLTYTQRLIPQPQITNCHRTANLSGDFDTIVREPHGNRLAPVQLKRCQFNFLKRRPEPFWDLEKSIIGGRQNDFWSIRELANSSSMLLPDDVCIN